MPREMRITPEATPEKFPSQRLPKRPAESPKERVSTLNTITHEVVAKAFMRNMPAASPFTVLLRLRAIASTQPSLISIRREKFLSAPRGSSSIRRTFANVPLVPERTSRALELFGLPATDREDCRMTQTPMATMGAPPTSPANLGLRTLPISRPAHIDRAVLSPVTNAMSRFEAKETLMRPKP